jgi:hypothetical protein
MDADQGLGGLLPPTSSRSLHELGDRSIQFFLFFQYL